MSLRSAALGASLLVLMAAPTFALRAPAGKPTGAQSADAPGGDFFETSIRPVLASKCYACHSSTLAAPKGELVLDTEAGVLRGGRLGPAIVPGKPAESRLLQALSYGATDEFGFKAVENRVSIHDLHATILHQLGIDHEKLTYRYAGRDFRLTDVFGSVVKEILV